MEREYHIAELIYKHNSGRISQEEKEELESWIEEDSNNRTLFEKATNTGFLLDQTDIYGLFDKQKVWKNVESELFDKKVVKMDQTRWYRYAAAIIIPLIALGGILYVINQKPVTSNLASADMLIQPGTQKATLLLADGESVALEGEEVPSVITQEDTRITNKDSQLTYETTEAVLEQKPLIFNELITPNGGTYNLTLADGTKVWLNAGSSLRFPISFADSTRQVFLAGEALFDVTHSTKPFIVTSDNQNVRVLGTVFNISAYPDEEVIKTTLVEGKVEVEVKNGGSISDKVVIKPNDQASLSKSGNNLEVSVVNTDRYTSWVEGKFVFDKDNLDQVMKQLARWYDFEYRFERDDIRDYHFSGRINNTESISSILEMLQLTTDVKFAMDDQTIVIL